jgi:uncharacterized membrane protein
MDKGRLEAFSDGVLAIIITIMVLELKIPEGPELSYLFELGPTIVAFVAATLVSVWWIIPARRDKVQASHD